MTDIWDVAGDRKLFHGGKQDFNKAASAAAECSLFMPDYEEERVADELRSCYNCLYRRWTSNSFQCMKNIERT